MAAPLVASVIIPVRNGGLTCERTLRAVLAQHLDSAFEVVLVDSESTDQTVETAKRLFSSSETNPAGVELQLIQIPVREFGHGRTRNLGARRARGTYLVYLSHDATPVGESWLERFLRPFEDEQVAGAFCRQVATREARLSERFMLRSTYPPESSIRTRNSLQSFGATHIQFSNAASTVRRDVWQLFPFDEDLMVCEDQDWGTRVLQAGYLIHYLADVCVSHTHRDSLLRMLSRNFDYAISNRRSAYTKVSATSYARYLRSEAGYIRRHGGVGALPEMFAVEMARSTGYFLGTHGGRLPKKLCMRLTSYPLWFDSARGK